MFKILHGNIDDHILTLNSLKSFHRYLKSSHAPTAFFWRLAYNFNRLWNWTQYYFIRCSWSPKNVSLQEISCMTPLMLSYPHHLKSSHTPKTFFWRIAFSISRLWNLTQYYFHSLPPVIRACEFARKILHGTIDAHLAPSSKILTRTNIILLNPCFQ